MRRVCKKQTLNTRIYTITVKANSFDLAGTLLSVFLNYLGSFFLTYSFGVWKSVRELRSV